jgi:hypothetical protein
MPATERFVVRVIVEFVVDGNDYAGVARLAEDQVRPVVRDSRAGHGYPRITEARVAAVKISQPRPA